MSSINYANNHEASVQGMLDFQRGMSKAQATPLVGFAIISPIKAVVSLVQIAVGLVFAVICAIFSAFTGGCGTPCGKGFTKGACTSMAHAGLGMISLTYSIVNILSFGIASLVLEGSCLGCKGIEHLF